MQKLSETPENVIPKSEVKALKRAYSLILKWLFIS